VPLVLAGGSLVLGVRGVLPPRSGHTHGAARCVCVWRVKVLIDASNDTIYSPTPPQIANSLPNLSARDTDRAKDQANVVKDAVMRFHLRERGYNCNFPGSDPNSVRSFGLSEKRGEREAKRFFS
jgi:hypothetical protein